MKLGEHLRLSPVVRGAHEPYRYEREVEEFLRWSPHVRNCARDALAGQLVALDRPGAEAEPSPRSVRRRLRGAGRGSSPRGGRGHRSAPPRRSAVRRPSSARARRSRRRAEAAARPRRPARAASRGAAPVEHYDDLAAEEVIALLGSLEADDLAALRDHEREHARRDGVLAAIDSVLARAGARAIRRRRKPPLQPASVRRRRP